MDAIYLGKVPPFGISIYFNLRLDNDKKVKKDLEVEITDVPDNNRNKKMKVGTKEVRKEERIDGNIEEKK